jgi:hypothetical protein
MIREWFLLWSERSWNVVLWTVFAFTKRWSDSLSRMHIHIPLWRTPFKLSFSPYGLSLWNARIYWFSHECNFCLFVLSHARGNEILRTKHKWCVHCMNHVSPLSAIFSGDVVCPDVFQFGVFLRVLSVRALPTAVSRSSWMYGHQERLFMA